MRKWLGILCLFPFVLFGAPKSWMFEQVEQDLQPFSKVSAAKIRKVYREEVKRGNPFQLALVKVEKGKSSIECSLSHPRIALLEEAFRSLNLPDTLFLLCIDDACDSAKLPVPVFAFAKDLTRSQGIVLIPDFEALSGNPTFLSEVAIGRKQFPWKKKREQIIWRGATTGGEFTLENFLSYPRSKAVTLSLNAPKLVNAKYTDLCQCSEKEQVEGYYTAYFGQKLPVSAHLAYKYQLLIDGNTCAYSRAYWQLFSGSLIFKQTSPSIQWFYRGLQENTHFVPVANDLSDLIEKIEWAKSHDDEAKAIARRARKWAKENIELDQVRTYLTLLLEKYSERLKA